MQHKKINKSQIYLYRQNLFNLCLLMTLFKPKKKQRACIYNYDKEYNIARMGCNICAQCEILHYNSM